MRDQRWPTSPIALADVPTDHYCRWPASSFRYPISPTRSQERKRRTAIQGHTSRPSRLSNRGCYEYHDAVLAACKLCQWTVSTHIPACLGTRRRIVYAFPILRRDADFHCAQDSGSHRWTRHVTNHIDVILGSQAVPERRSVPIVLCAPHSVSLFPTK